jgi:hypothetical protein
LANGGFDEGGDVIAIVENNVSINTCGVVIVGVSKNVNIRKSGVIVGANHNMKLCHNFSSSSNFSYF